LRSFQRTRLFDSIEKPSVHSFEILRVCTEFIEVTNGSAVRIVGDFPFMLSLVEAFLGFFRSIIF
jgi:hypothetical protein